MSYATWLAAEASLREDEKGDASAEIEKLIDEMRTDSTTYPALLGEYGCCPDLLSELISALYSPKQAGESFGDYNQRRLFTAIERCDAAFESLAQKEITK